VKRAAHRAEEKGSRGFPGRKEWEEGEYRKMKGGKGEGGKKKGKISEANKLWKLN